MTTILLFPEILNTLLIKDLSGFNPRFHETVVVSVSEVEEERPAVVYFSAACQTGM